MKRDKDHGINGLTDQLEVTVCDLKMSERGEGHKIKSLTQKCGHNCDRKFVRNLEVAICNLKFISFVILSLPTVA